MQYHLLSAPFSSSFISPFFSSFHFILFYFSFRLFRFRSFSFSSHGDRCYCFYVPIIDCQKTISLSSVAVVQLCGAGNRCTWKRQTKNQQTNGNDRNETLAKRISHAMNVESRIRWNYFIHRFCSWTRSNGRCVTNANGKDEKKHAAKNAKEQITQKTAIEHRHALANVCTRCSLLSVCTHSSTETIN